MKRLSLILIMIFLISGSLWAQRKTDALGRGLVAVNMNNGSNLGNFISWRILAEEYYDVTYNIYRDGTKLNTTPLTVSNYTDSKGTATSSYTVRAVVRGVEQTQCTAVTPWSSEYYKINVTSGTHREYPGYKDITLQSVSSYGGVDMTNSYTTNDAEVADLDGDGEMEIILKRISNTDNDNLYVKMTDPAYDIFEAYKMDGTRLWWIDAGPNMVSGSSTEFNLIAYDWDEDGKAEVVLRGADGMVLHHSDGTTTTIGDVSVNTRDDITHTANMTYTHTGSEFLIYMNGETGKEYQVLTYPLKRLEDGETDLKTAWGDYYGHRSSKYFMGAPFLDGRKPSIFLARGIYTRHKMAAYDVNTSNHTLTQRWTWNCSDTSSDWFGNGYHNFGIADVDWDGRDEIVYGSMVIDDNGKGLSTTGLGHGDAQHCGDLDPYRHGQEIFACNEDNPAMNYRDAKTSELLYRKKTSTDDGRALCGNFSNTYPGCEGASSQSGVISCVAKDSILTYSSFFETGELNFRIYWDGDLCDEILWSKSENGNPMINKPGEGRLFTATSCSLNSGTKDVPCFAGDIIGDWREEMIVRYGTTAIRIYTTALSTNYGIYTLWHDMQYRQAMVWQMHAYNQPPHPSFFLGEMEGITVAPPPLTMTGRTEISNGGTISTTNDNTHVMMCETNDMTVGVTDGAAPYIFTDNAPTWVQGHGDNSNITTTTYTHTLTDGAFTGSMRLVKQGDGILVLPDVTEAYTGTTNVWAGTLKFDGTMSSSPVWLNRFAILNSDGGNFKAGITMDYGSQLLPGSGGIKARSLTMNFGSRVVYDLTDGTADKITADTLRIDTVEWTDGPKYLKPVFEFSGFSANGKYLIGNYQVIEGDIANITVEGVTNGTLELSNHNLYLVIGNGTTTYTSKKWDFTQDWDVTADILGTSGSGWTAQTTSGYMPGYTYTTQLSSAELNYVSNSTTTTLAKTADLYFTTNKATNRVVVPTTFDHLHLNTATTFTIKDLKAGQTIVICCKSRYGSSPVTLSASNCDITSVTTTSTATEYTFTVSAGGDVTFTVTGSYLIVDYIELKAVTSSVVLDDKATVYTIASQTADATLKDRTIWSDGWNTLCLPLSLTADEVATYFGADTQLREFNSVSGDVLNFTAATKVEAGKPYLIKTTSDKTGIVFLSAAIQDVDPQKVTVGSYSFAGTYIKYKMATDGTELFVGSGDMLVQPAVGTETMPGYRAYFIVPSGSAAAAKMCIFDTSTGIGNIERNVATDNNYYNLQGQKVSSTGSAKLKKGIYIHKGKKVIIK